MSRTRNALIFSLSAYGHFGLSIVAALFLVPLTMRTVGMRDYGMWLAAGEFLGYLALSDLGVFAVFPWLVGAADGRRDWATLRSYVSNGLVVSLLVALVMVLGGLAVWHLSPGLLLPNADDRAKLAGPLAVLLIGAAAGFPLKVFQSLLSGLQDALFGSVVMVGTIVLSVVLTVVLLLQGYGLYALAYSATLPPLVTGTACGLRVCWVRPEILRDLPGPSATAIARLFNEGFGGWLGSFGYRLMTAANGLILLGLGYPELVAVYACTIKLPQLAQQLCWIPPDSALVGLAQLHGEQKTARAREVVGSILQLQLVLSGLAAALLLLFNPSFVRWWVGAELYGGDSLNTWLAVGLILACLVHGVTTTVAVVGWRLPIGLATLVNGLLHLGVALLLVPPLGLAGFGIAAVVSSAASTLVVGTLLVVRVFGLSPRQLLADMLWPWAVRTIPLLATAAVIGPWLASQPFWLVTVATGIVGIVGLGLSVPLLSSLPLPERLRRPLARFRFLVHTEGKA